MNENATTMHIANLVHLMVDLVSAMQPCEMQSDLILEIAVFTVCFGIFSRSSWALFKASLLSLIQKF